MHSGLLVRWLTSKPNKEVHVTRWETANLTTMFNVYSAFESIHSITTLYAWLRKLQ